MVVHYQQDVSDIPSRVLQGFTGSGMVASLALYHLFDVFNFKQIGYVSLNEMPPVAAVKDGVAMHPLRIYASPKLGYAIVCDVPLPEAAVPLAVDELITWYSERSIKEIITVGGLPSGREIMEDDVNVQAVLNGIELPFGDTSKLPIMHKGATYGSIALTLLKSKEARIPCVAFLAECIPNIPDYGATVSLLQQLAEYLDLPVDTEELSKSASELRSKLMDDIPHLNGNGSPDSGSYT